MRIGSDVDPAAAGDGGGDQRAAALTQQRNGRLGSANDRVNLPRLPLDIGNDGSLLKDGRGRGRVR